MNVYGLTDKAIEEKKGNLSQTLISIDENTVEQKQKRQDYKAATEEKLILEEELTRVSTDANRLLQEIRVLEPNINRLQSFAETTKIELKDDERTKKIGVAIEEHETVYDVMETRLQSIQDGLSINKENYKTPKVFSDAFRSEVNSRSFSQGTATLRAIVDRYKLYVKEVCTSKVDGKKVSVKSELEINDYIDQVLKHDSIIDRWS